MIEVSQEKLQIILDILAPAELLSPSIVRELKLEFDNSYIKLHDGEYIDLNITGE